MNRERLLMVLDAYGSEERAWPEEERQALKALLEIDSDARGAFHRARELDLQLALLQPSVPDLSEAIMRAVPMGPFERLTTWLLPGGGASIMRPALLGMLPFFFGVALGLSTPEDSDALATGGWEFEERLLLMPPEGGSWYE